MIASNIKGGLCNQMFQIAAGYAHAKRCGTFYGINYGLEHNCIQGHPPTKYKDTLYKNIMTINDVPDDVYHEPKFEYSPIPKKKDLLIDGYFQSEKYFADYRDEVKDLFSDQIFLMMFWIHFISINLFTGGWIVKDSQKFSINKVLMAVPLIVTYLIGPIGLFLYWIIRIFYAKRISLYE